MDQGPWAKHHTHRSQTQSGGKLHLCSTVLAAWNIPDPSAAADSVLTAPHSSSSAPQPVGPGKATSIMSVTALLQRMTDWVCSDAPLPDHSLWAPVFYDLDQAWASTHGQTLSTPQFVQALSTYILIKEQVAPSSDTAVHIKEVVNSIAKVRIKLLRARGDTYGMTPAGSEPEPQGIGTSAATSADQFSPAERLSLLSEVLTDMETAYQDRVNKLHKDLAECMEDEQGNLIELLDKFLHSAGTLSTNHLRDLYSHLSVCLAQKPPRMQGAHLRRALESRLREGGLSDDWIRSRFKSVADRVTGVVRTAACNHTASRAQARESALPSGGLSRCSTKGGRQHGSTYVCLQVTSEKCKRWFAVFRTAGCPSTKYAALCLEKRVHCEPTRDGQEPQTSTINRAPVINHAQQVQKANFGYSGPGRTISKALLRNRTKKARHIAGHQLALTSCCQRSKCKDLCMMRPPPSFKVIGQPGQTSWPRPGERTANAGTLRGSPFPPDWRQIVLGQVHTAALPRSTLHAGDAKASHLHSDLEQELSSIVFKHVRVPSLRPCTWPRDCTHNQRLPAYTGAITSQKLFVVFHTAYPRGDSAIEAMPSPSAKLKSSRRLPKHLRVSGTPPSGAIAQAREEAEARYNRGESNRRGQHSSVQGRRTGAETGDQWQARTWQRGWYASYQQESWHADSSCSSADPWHAWPSAADPTSRWRPRVEVSPRQKEAGANETQEGWNGTDPVATACRMDIQVTEPTTEAKTPRKRHGLPDTQTPTQPQSKKPDHDLDRTTAEGTRFSAPEGSSSDELMLAESDQEERPAPANKGQIVYSDSEELIPDTESGQAGDGQSLRTMGDFVFPAPAPDTQGGPDEWNKLPIAHVNKKLLKWWTYLGKAEAATPTAEEFLRAFFLTRPGANGESIFLRLGKAEHSCFDGFVKFLVGAGDDDCPASEEQLAGYHGTHLHTLWSIMRAGMAESGPSTPGSRFFQVPRPNGTTVDVAGTYCFQQALHHKSLNYADAVLLQEHNASQDTGPTAIRLVIEISFFRSDICKRGKQTDQCIVQKPSIKAVHAQVTPARMLALGTRTMEWHPLLEASPEKYAGLIQGTQAALFSGGGGHGPRYLSAGGRGSATGEVQGLALSNFDPGRGDGHSGIDQAGLRSSAPDASVDDVRGQPAPYGVSMEGPPKKEYQCTCSHANRASRRVYATVRKPRPCQARSGLDPDGQRHASAPTLGQGHDTGPDALASTLGVFELLVFQVPAFSKTHAYQPKGGYQAGRSRVLLRTHLALVWLHDLRLGKRHPVTNLMLPAHADDTASQRLLVGFHTAHKRVGAQRTAMPSPSAKLKAARRLPKHLRVSGRPPSGAIAQARAEAEARFLRGESCRAGQHSSLQGRQPAVEASGQHMRPEQEQSNTASGPAFGQRKRPHPPAPPIPRWRPRQEVLAASMESQSVDHADTHTGSQPMGRSEADSGTQHAASDTTALRTKVEAHEPLIGTGEATTVLQAQARDCDYAHWPTETGSRFSAPDSSSEELVEIEETTAARRHRRLDSATQVRVCGEVHSSQSTAKGSRTSAPYCNSEELVEIEVDMDDAGPGSHLDGQLDSVLAPPSDSGRPALHEGQTASGRARPWSRADTELSKTLSQILRHKSRLQLDSAGYAGIPEILTNSRIQRHQATEAWLLFIIQENDKKRFTLDETGTRVRAAQGHSVYINPDKLLTRLSLADLGQRLPMQAYHSTFRACLRPILQQGLIPGGRKGDKFRRHVHLATDRTPIAGLRSGSEVILEVDVERAINSGCTFHLSENGVLLTADTIPPLCITRATRADNAQVIGLDRLRQRHKLHSAALCLLMPVIADLHRQDLTRAYHVLQTLPLYGRLTSGSGLARLARQNVRQALRLPIKPTLPCLGVAPYLRQPFRPRRVMQPGTPVGQERRYSWKATAGRSVASTPPGSSLSPPEEGPAAAHAPQTDLPSASGVAGTAMRRPGNQAGPRCTPRPSRAPWLPDKASKRQRTYLGFGQMPARDDSEPELDAEGLRAPAFARGGTAYYVGDDPMESSQATTHTRAEVRATTDSQGSRDVRYEATSPSKQEGHSQVGAAHTSQGTEAAENSLELQTDLTETAIDFSFATQGLSADTPRSHRSTAYRPVKAVAKSLVRSGLRCPKCHLLSWICLCGRAPVEIDRRGNASGLKGRYMHPCPFSKHCTAISYVPAADHCMGPLSGLATPRQQARQVLVPAFSFRSLSRTACAGKSARAGHSALGRRTTGLLLVLFSSYDGLKQGRAGSALTPVSELETNARKEPLRHPYSEGSGSSLPDVHVTSSFAPPKQIIRGNSYKQISAFSRAQLPRTPIIAAFKPKRGPKSAPLRTSKRGVRVSPPSAGGGGPRKSRLWTDHKPGKLADGSHHLSTSCNGSSAARTPDFFDLRLANSYKEWGRFFRRSRFRYLTLIKRKSIKIIRPPSSHTIREPGTTRTPNRGVRSGTGVATIPKMGRVLFFGLLHFCSMGGVSGSPHPNHYNSATLQPAAKKRAWIKVNRRAAAGRPAWYRNLLITEPRIQLPIGGQEHRTRRPGNACRRGGVERLSILSLNVGSLSGFLWTEIKAYIASPRCEADFILLQEVHWRQTCSFRVGGWSAFVSATTEKADGVMILAHPRYQDSQLKFDEVVRGRVLRVQVSLQKEKVELFCVYQRVWQNQLSKSANIEQRQSLLSKLAAQVRSIAKRSTVIVAGDFNAEVLPTPGRVGRCVPQTPRHVGPDSPDPRALTRFVEETEMVVLNTWCLRDPLTYHSTTGSSQIDFVMVRAPSADHRARQCHPAEPPVGSWRSMGHRSLHASIRLVKHYHIQAPAKQHSTLNIRALQEQARSGGADIDKLRSDVRSEVEAMSHSDPDEALHTLNSIVLRAASRAFPRQAAPKRPTTVDFVPLWQLRASLRKHWRRDLQGIFKAWWLSHLHARKAAEARRTHVEAKRAHTRQLLGEAQQAQEAHLPHRVYQLVSRLKPWQPRTKPRLKSGQGELLSNEGELNLLKNYCHEVFSPQVAIPATGKLAFDTDADNWTKLLRQTGFNKAVPTGQAPSAAWRACADVVGEALSRISATATRLQKMPASWSSPELIWLPKPLKVPDDPSRLRPIGLLTPVAKAAAASIRGLLMDGILASLHTIPQFAYLPGRDLSDALARVNHRMEVIRTSLRFSTTNRFDQRTIRENTRQGGRWLHPICGGAVLSIDLHKAFDMVSREQLASTLAELTGPDEAKAAALRLHTECIYHLSVAGQGAAIHTTRGVRQGCRLAPALWSAVTGDLLRRMTEDPRSGPYTVFADDHLGSWVFHTLDDLRRMDSEVTALLKVLTAAGMVISPSKSKLILKLKGAAALKFARSRQVKKNGIWHWNFQTDGNTFLIPIEEEVTYLGTILTFGRQADRTVEYRLEEARRRECQLKRCIRSRSVLGARTRVQIWRSCVVTTALHGLMGLELDAKLASRLRQWFHKSLRAVTNLPAHLTKVSNEHLCTRFEVKEPIAMLHDLTCNKLRKLHSLDTDHISADPCVLDHWAACARALEALRHTTNLVPIQMPSGCVGVPCPECGQYFSSIKAVRQHAARRHGVKTVALAGIVYRQEEHSQHGMPQCVHCGRRCGSSDGLRHHILTNACQWHQPADPLVTQAARLEEVQAAVLTGNADQVSLDAGEQRAAQGDNLARGCGLALGHVPTPPTDVTAPGATNADVPIDGTPQWAALQQGFVSHEPTEGPPSTQPQSSSAAPAVPNRRPEESSLSVHTILQRSNALQTISDIPQTCRDWAPRLSQHCGLCNNWAMDKSSVKCHLIRKHAEEWHSHSQAVSKLCVSHKHLIRRDAHCPFCDKMVYGAERHAVQCPVLFQVCLLYLMRVGTDSVLTTWQDLGQLDRQVCTSRIQAGEFTYFTQFAQPLSHFCLLCAQDGIDERIVDMQQLKRHLRNAHRITKESLASICDSQFASIEMKRPCSFCSQQYQKSPQLHKSKCVPLVQLLALIHGQHGRPGIGGGTSGGFVGALQPIIHTPPAADSCPGDSRDEQRHPGQQGRTASQVPQIQRQGRQGQRSGQETTRTLDGWRRSVGRPEPELGISDVEDAGSPSRTFLEPACRGQDVRPVLQHERHGHPDAAQGDHQQLAEGLPGEENHYHSTRSSPHQPLAGAGDKAHQAGIGPGGDETLRGLRTPSSPPHEVVVHGLGPRETAVPPYGGATAGQPGDSRCPEDSQGRRAHGRSDTQVLTAPQTDGQSAIQGGCLPTRLDHKAHGGEGPRRDVEAHQPGCYIPGGYEDPAREAADFPPRKTNDATIDGGLRAPHPRQDSEQESGRQAGHQVNRGSRSPHPSLGGHAKDGHVQPTGGSDTLPPGQPSKGNASTLRRGRPDDCRGLAASEATQSKQAASAQNDTFSKSTKRLMQTSLSSWQVSSGAADLEAPCYMLTNRANYCYMNASAAALHWAMRAMNGRPSDFGSLGPALMAISKLRRLEIPTHHDWKILLRGWRRPTQQHDAAEFMSHIVDPGSNATAGRWQARCLERGRSPVREESNSAPHIGINIATHHDLQSAVNAWHQQHYTHALSTPPKLLCLQLGRFRHEGRRTVKVRQRCSVPHRLQVPAFTGELLECHDLTYALCSGIAHIGDTATSGHYRAMCVHSPLGQGRSEASSPTPRYTLCDDDRQASQNSSRLDNLLDHNLYVVLYCRLDPEPGPSGRSQ